MSVVYRSTVSDMSVNCRWHIGQLSVAYQSCINLAGESSGFPFERLSNVIMLYIPNRTFLVRFGGISGEFGRAMVRILARRSRGYHRISGQWSWLLIG